MTIFHARIDAGGVSVAATAGSRHVTGMCAAPCAQPQALVPQTCSPRMVVEASRALHLPQPTTLLLPSVEALARELGLGRRRCCSLASAPGAMVARETHRTPFDTNGGVRDRVVLAAGLPQRNGSRMHPGTDRRGTARSAYLGPRYAARPDRRYVTYCTVW